MDALQFRIKIGPQEIVLRQGETLIGRSEECGICLDDERLSRVHAKINLVGSQAEVLDLGSRNGTYVNDLRIKDRAVLQSGDVIRVGQTKMQLVVTGRRARQSSSRTLGGATMLDVNTQGGGEESDVLQRVLQIGRLDEAEKILKARVANLVRTDPPLRADHMLSRNVVVGMIAMAEKSMDARWLHRLFKLHATCRWFMAEESQKRVEQLIRALGRVGGDGVIEYLTFWTERSQSLSEAQRTQLGRLKDLASRDSIPYQD